MTYVVDTHALIWYLTNSPRLGGLAKQALLDPTALLVISAIALAEIRFLSQRGRIPLAWDDVQRLLKDDARCVVHPVHRDIVDHMPSTLNIHDALICATALFYHESLGEDVKVLTKDRAIVASGLVETVW
ncbi:MAG: PIN domain-containing protein [Dehalococcoidia bacterium]